MFQETSYVALSFYIYNGQSMPQRGFNFPRATCPVDENEAVL